MPRDLPHPTTPSLAEPSFPIQVILTTNYWTVLFMLAVFFSLCSYVVITWASQSYQLFRISPKNFPFLCEPQQGTG